VANDAHWIGGAQHPGDEISNSVPVVEIAELIKGVSHFS
jgi:hypothetical protein